MPLYREDLARCRRVRGNGRGGPGAGAGACGGAGAPAGARGQDAPLYLHAGCHLDAPLWLYVQGGLLTIECSVCQKGLATLVLASRAEAAPPLLPRRTRGGRSQPRRP